MTSDMYAEIAFNKWWEREGRELAARLAHAPELSDSEPQESEQAETKQKDKAGEDV
jgi:hypothetical protein